MAQVKFVVWLAGLVNKSTPTDTDQMYVGDAGTSKYATWANVKATLKTYMDTLYAKIGLATGSGLTSATAKLLGRSTAGTGALEEITLGTNLTFSGTTLNAAGGGGGSPGGVTTQVQYNNAGAFDGANLFVDSATTLAQRNGTNAQVFRVYNTYTDASNYERVSIGVISGRACFDYSTAGTGNTDLNVWIGSDNGNANDNRTIIIPTGKLKFQTGGTVNIMVNGGAEFSQSDSSTGAYLGLIEMTAPAAPATNGVRIYAQDNGSGKTQLMARFATGAAVQIAIEP